MTATSWSALKVYVGRCQFFIERGGFGQCRSSLSNSYSNAHWPEHQETTHNTVCLHEMAVQTKSNFLFVVVFAWQLCSDASAWVHTDK